MSKTKEVVIYVRSVSVKKFTAPVSTLTIRPPRNIVPYAPPKKDIVPISKKNGASASTSTHNNEDDEYIYYML
jgi:hypothetical protein